MSETEWFCDCAVCYEYGLQEWFVTKYRSQMLDEWHRAGFDKDTPLVERLGEGVDKCKERQQALRDRCPCLKERTAYMWTEHE